MVRSNNCSVMSPRSLTLGVSRVCGLYVSIALAEFDKMWMPLWRCCARKTRYRYCHVDGSGLSTTVSPDGPRAVEVYDLPEQPAGAVRLVFISDSHGKHDQLGRQGGCGWRSRLGG